MVMPLFDDNTGRRTTPVVNYVLIALNVLVFVVFQGMGENKKFTYAFSCVPEEIRTGQDVVTEGGKVRDPVTGKAFPLPDLEPTPIPVYLTLLTSMFMHGGMGHIFFNMLFLWIFGDNVEDEIGHLRYGSSTSCAAFSRDWLMSPVRSCSQAMRSFRALGRQARSPG